MSFKDLSPLYEDPALMLDLTRELTAGLRADRILAIEARGFILGTMIATYLKKPLTLLRKPGKLPGQTVAVTYETEYSQDKLEVQAYAIKPGERITIVDDVIATGGTIDAAIRLCNIHEAHATTAVAIMDLTFLGGSGKLRQQGIEVRAATSEP